MAKKDTNKKALTIEEKLKQGKVLDVNEVAEHQKAIFEKTQIKK